MKNTHISSRCLYILQLWFPSLQLLTVDIILKCTLRAYPFSIVTVHPADKSPSVDKKNDLIDYEHQTFILFLKEKEESKMSEEPETEQSRKRLYYVRVEVHKFKGGKMVSRSMTTAFVCAASALEAEHDVSLRCLENAFSEGYSPQVRTDGVMEISAERAGAWLLAFTHARPQAEIDAEQEASAPEESDEV